MKPEVVVASSVLASLLTVMVPAGTAAAQAPGQVPLAPACASAPEPVSEGVSPEAATLISLGGTLASYALLVGGLNHPTVGTIGAVGTLIMPSVGRWYAHSAGYGGLLIRIAGAGAAFGGIALAFSECPLFGSDGCDHGAQGIALLGMVAGAVAYLGGTVYDIGKASEDAQDYNAHLRQVALVPIVQPDHGSYGVALAGRF